MLEDILKNTSVCVMHIKKVANLLDLALYFQITCICTKMEKLRKDVADYESNLQISA